MATYHFDTLAVSQAFEYVYHVQLNRPDKRNAVNMTMRRDIRECFNQLADDPDCRAIVLSGSGKMFCAGIDLSEYGSRSSNRADTYPDPARRGFAIRRDMKNFQNSLTAIAKCPKPVIAAINNGCIGAGLDLISCCDIRLCSKDSYFSVKEVEVGLAADIGSLQRLPKIVGNDSIIRELAFTARNFSSVEAKDIGLISSSYDDKKSTLDSALNLARIIASRSPVAVVSTKVNLNFSRDHSVDDGLEYISAWNMCMLQTDDIQKIRKATTTRTRPIFSKL